MTRTLIVAVVLCSSLASLSHGAEPPAPGPAAGVYSLPAAEEPAARRSDAAPAAPDTAAPKAPGVVEVAPPEAREWWQQSGWWLVFPTWLLALVSLGLALYVARLWKATTAIVAQQQETSRRELRAYVALDEIFFSEAEEPAAAQHKLRIRNYGQTPASAMSIWCERASHLPQEGVKPFYDAPIVDGQLLHPVQAFTVGLASAPLYRIGKPGFFTYGRIIYQDIYRQWWVTKFCFRYEGDGSFVPHGDYNAEEGPFDKAPA